MSDKKDILNLIKSNIDNFGYHLYLISGSTSPRVLYTIGLKGKLSGEFVFAGGTYYSNDDVVEVVKLIIEKCIEGNHQNNANIYLKGVGNFSLKKVDKSWIDTLMLGATDFHGNNDFDAYQITPEEAFMTIDIPDMSKPFSAEVEPIWRYEKEEWNHKIAPDSCAVTNIDALQGACITEVVRWEDDQWEMFAGSGPDVPKENMRVVPLSTLITFDPSLEVVTQLEVEAGIWRHSKNDKWEIWD
ncbi:MAG: DUF4262 domain-containing protein [Marinicella sp.]